MYFVKTVDSVIKDRIRMSNIYNWDELCAVWQLKIYIFFLFWKIVVEMIYKNGHERDKKVKGKCL